MCDGIANGAEASPLSLVNIFTFTAKAKSIANEVYQVDGDESRTDEALPMKYTKSMVMRVELTKHRQCKM